MATIALLSNPSSTGNRAILPEIRQFCAEHPEIFHYEVERHDQIGEAMRTIAMVQPRVIAVNGGDGTVQSVLTELHASEHFRGNRPPVAVLPNGKTNLIALDLGASGSPIEALERVLRLAQDGMQDHVIERQLIALSQDDRRPVVGMFLGGAWLADIILYCRNRIYPLGLPNGVSHFLAAAAAIFAILLRGDGGLFPPKAKPVRVSWMRDGELRGRFSVLIVTTLEKLLLAGRTSTGQEPGHMKLLAVDRSLPAILRMAAASWRGKLGQRSLSGVHFGEGDEIRIEGDRSNVILDGELYEARTDHPIVLTSTPPVQFLRLAA